MPIIGNLGKNLWTGALPHCEDLVQPCWTPRLSWRHQRCSGILHSISGDLQTRPWNAKWRSGGCLGWNCRSQVAIGGVQRGSDMLSTILEHRGSILTCLGFSLHSFHSFHMDHRAEDRSPPIMATLMGT